VPPRAIGAYLGSVQEILARHDTRGIVFGHAGDGNVHVNPLVDMTRTDWQVRIRSMLEETVDLVAELGGTLTGEHGDGRLRAPFLERIWGRATTSTFRAVKDLLDPDGILNPGVVLPLEGQDPLEGFGVAPSHVPPGSRP
jgi:FAD/FMN-containing dehydrogenase